MKRSTVQRVGAKIFLPYILLFGLYVQFHGDFGPGGGFQAGVIFAAGIILHAIVFGLGVTRRVFTVRFLQILVALGVLLYGGVGVLTAVRGAHFLDYSVLAHDPKHGQHYGIFAVELGVGITVTAAMLLLFYAIAGRRAQ